MEYYVARNIARQLYMDVDFHHRLLRKKHEIIYVKYNPISLC